jgi:hypothetical protein
MLDNTGDWQKWSSVREWFAARDGASEAELWDTIPSGCWMLEIMRARLCTPGQPAPAAVVEAAAACARLGLADDPEGKATRDRSGYAPDDRTRHYAALDAIVAWAHGDASREAAAAAVAVSQAPTGWHHLDTVREVVSPVWALARGEAGHCPLAAAASQAATDASYAFDLGDMSYESMCTSEYTSVVREGARVIRRLFPTPPAPR